MNNYKDNDSSYLKYLFINNISVIDSGYLDKKHGLIGGSWIVDVRLSGKLNDESMIMDFGAAKSKIKKLLDDNLDHVLLLPKKSKDLSFEHNKKTERITLQYDFANSMKIEMEAPREAVYLLEADEINLPNLTLAVNTLLAKLAERENIYSIKATLHEEKSDMAYYNYCHGLKKHKGNCQRIAHGHRCGLTIYENGNRATIKENYIRDNLSGLYIGDSADLINEDSHYYEFSYESSQGKYRLKLPKEKCFIIEKAATIESIAGKITTMIKDKYPERNMEIRICEGIGKGATIKI